MRIPASAVELGSGVVGACSAGIAAIFKAGQTYGAMKSDLRDLHENQQAIADHLGIPLPHPVKITAPVGKDTR